VRRTGAGPLHRCRAGESSGRTGESSGQTGCRGSARARRPSQGDADAP